MNLSKTKIGLFFLAVLVLGSLLYPRALFLAFMYEGSDDLARAENYYLDYLSRHPYDRFASLRLAALYNRMAEPERAVPILKKLYGHRKGDWKVAQAWLNQLEEMHEDEALFKARRRVAREFKTVAGTRRQEVIYLLEGAFQYALWRQDYSAAYSILDDLEEFDRANIFYPENRGALNRALKKWDAVLGDLRAKIARDPKDMESRRDVINVYVAKRDLVQARREASAILKDSPDDMFTLQARAFILSKLKERKAAIADIERILTIGGVSSRQKLTYRADLGSLYRQEGELKKAMSIFQDLLRLHPETEAYWDNVLGILTEEKNWNGAVSLLKSYLKSFPQDLKKKKRLVDIYLYELKEPNALVLYAEYLESVRDVRFGLDVAFLLLERNWRARAEDWLERCAGLFPADARVIRSLAALYVDDKNYPAAAVLLERLLRAHPADVETILTLAQIKSLQGNPAAGALYERLATLKPDFETALLAGRELLFMGLPERAVPLLERAAERDPAKGEPHFWLAEAAASRGDRETLLSESRRAAALFETQPERSEEEERMELKSRARLGDSPGIRADYRSAIAKFPRNRDLRSDEIDMLLENGKPREARQALAADAALFPKDADRRRPYEVRLAFLESDWNRAASLLKMILVEHPLQWSYRRDLAEAETRAGRWKSGLKEYEAVRTATPEKFDLARTVNAMHDKYDSRTETEFRYVKLGGEHFFESGAAFSAWLTEKWRLNARADFGRFVSGLLNREDDAVRGGVSASFRVRPELILTGGLGFGASGARKTVTPSFGAEWNPSDRVSLAAEGAYGRLRADLPQAVARGTLTDVFDFRAQWAPVARLIFGARYGFERNVLPQGQASYGQRVEPTAAFVLKREPDVSVGYQFSFVDNSNGNGFLNLVGLVPRVQAHYLTAFAAHDFSEGAFHLEGNAFWGEDTARNLHLFEADLFGAGVRAEFRATRFLKLRAGYEFGRETLVNAAGTSHQAGVGVTGHW